jgi:hypothetical protein
MLAPFQYGKTLASKQNIEIRLADTGSIQIQQAFEYKTKLSQYRKSLESMQTFTSVNTSTTTTTGTLVASENSAFKPFKRSSPDTLLDQTTAMLNKHFPNGQKLVILNRYLLKYQAGASLKRSSSCICFDGAGTFVPNRSRSMSLSAATRQMTDDSRITLDDVGLKHGKSTRTEEMLKRNKKNATPSSMSSVTGLLRDSKSINKFPFSESLVELIVLIFRLQDAGSNIADIILPTTICKMNPKYFQSKFQSIAQTFKVRHFHNSKFYVRKQEEEYVNYAASPKAILNRMVSALFKTDILADLVDYDGPVPSRTSFRTCVFKKISFLKLSVNLINHYLDNLFALDVCATPEIVTTKIFGPEV